MKFIFKQKGRKSPRDESLIKLLKSPAIMASGVSTIFLPSDLDELCNMLNLLLQERQAGNNVNIINAEIVAIVDKLLENKSFSEKKHKQFLFKYNLLHKK